jgi:formate-dependent nitrite reductase cytochrome c552 subunit
LIRNKTVAQQTTAERDQIARFLQEEEDEFKRTQFNKVLLQQKKEVSTLCAKCSVEMYFGDEDGVMTRMKVSNKASPDRLDNSNPFYDSDNFVLCCQSCNWSENEYSRRHKEVISTKQPSIPLTQDLLSKIVVYLKNRIETL